MRERRVIEAASIEGRGFHRGAVRALVDQKRDASTPRSPRSVDRELIRPDRPEFPGETGYRFTHILVRDAAYDLLPKRRRADLHVAYAGWLLGRDDRGSAADEIVGYHLEQAHEYRSQLGRVGDDRHRELAARASGHLSDAGRRALAAGDSRRCLEPPRARGRASPEADPDRAALLIDLGGVHREQGRFRESEAALREARALAVDAGDAALEARAQVARLLSRLQVDPDAVATAHAPAGETACSGRSRPAATTPAWRSSGTSARCSGGSRRSAGRGGAGLAARRPTRRCLAGDERMFADAVGWEASSTAVGPTPVETRSSAAARSGAILENDPWAEALALQPLASLHAMRGEFDVAFSLLDESAATLAGFGPTLDAAVSHPEVFVAVLAGDFDAGRAAPAGRPAAAGADGRARGARIDRGPPRAAAPHDRA